LNVRYIWEPRLGKSLALNTGIKHARGEILGFLDDDILPEKNWLLVLRREFSADPSLGLLSGRVELYDPADLPMTVRRQTERTEAQSFDDLLCLLIGCNFATRRELVDRVGLFDPELGPGSKFCAGEDADFFCRALRAGEKLVYEPSLFVYHNHGRRSLDAGLKARRGYLIARGAIYAKHILRRDKRVAKEMYWDLSLTDLRWLANRNSRRDKTWMLKGFGTYVLARPYVFFAAVFGKQISRLGNPRKTTDGSPRYDQL